MIAMMIVRGVVVKEGQIIARSHVLTRRGPRHQGGALRISCGSPIRGLVKTRDCAAVVAGAARLKSGAIKGPAVALPIAHRLVEITRRRRNHP